MTVKHISQKELMDDHFDKRVRDFIHTSFPAVITRVVSRYKVDVLPLVETMRPDGSKIRYPELFDVRVMTLSSMQGQMRVSMPLMIGDKVWVTVSERDVDVLMRNGVVAASTTLTHDLSDCFCIPCFYTDVDLTSPILSDDPTALVVGNQSTTIKLNASSIAIQTLDTSVSGNISIDGETVCKTSVDSPKYITEGIEGVSGEFVSVDDKIVTVKNGIIVGIVEL